MPFAHRSSDPYGPSVHKITVNGASIAYDEAGTGSPVVLLHAGIADRRMWRGSCPRSPPGTG